MYLALLNGLRIWYAASRIVCRLLVSWFPSFAADSSLVAKWRSVATRRLLRQLRLRFYTDPVVHGAAQLLLAPEVTLRGLDRDVTEQELDLIQFAAS